MSDHPDLAISWFCVIDAETAVEVYAVGGNFT